MHRRLAISATAIAVAFLSISWIGGDRFANLLVLNLQLWRATWLPVLLAACFVPLVFSLLPSAGPSRRLFLCAVVTNTVEARLGSGAIPFASATLALATVAAYFAGTASRWGAIARILSSALAAAGTLLVLAEVAAFVTQYDWPFVIDAAKRAVIILGLILLAVAVTGARPVPPFAAVAAITILALSTALIADQRDARMRLITSQAPLDSAFETALAGRTVYWEQGLELQWFRLRQPSYYSCFQSAGIVFFRDTAIETARRAKVLSTLNTADFPTDPAANCPPRRDPDADGPTSRAQLAEVCRALPELDALVLYAGLDDVPHLTWRPGFPLHGAKKTSLSGKDAYHLYACADLR